MADNVSSAGSTSMYSYEDYVKSQQLRTPKQNLGKDDFLNLLVAQMKYQDPMEPTKDTEFVAQLAQFSSLEQINALNNTMATYQAYSLAGKFVYGVVTDLSGLKYEVAGFVDRVVISNGEPWLQVGDNLMKASDVTEVYDSATAMGDNPLLANVNLIGKYAMGKTSVTSTDAEGNTTVKVTEHEGYITRVSADETLGMVAHITKEDGTEVKVSLSNIYNVGLEAPAKKEDEGSPETETPETDPEI